MKIKKVIRKLMNLINKIQLLLKKINKQKSMLKSSKMIYKKIRIMNFIIMNRKSLKIQINSIQNQTKIINCLINIKIYK